MASKANLVHKSERFGSLFSNNDLEVLYPGFYDSHYLPEPLLQWLTDGIWNRDLLDEYIEQHFRSSSALSPKDQVRNSRIDYLEEDIARAGLFDILPDAYNGELSLNEYVFLIINSRLARYYGLITPDIDWDKVCQGIEKRIELSIQNGEKIELLKETIEDLEDFSIAERRAYQIIKKARDVCYHKTEQVDELHREYPYNTLKSDPENIRYCAVCWGKDKKLIPLYDELNCIVCRKRLR